MFVRCGRRLAINPVHVAFIEEMNLTGAGPLPLRVGLAAGIVLDLNEEEAAPMRAFLDLMSPLPAKRTMTPARSGSVKKRDD